MSATPVTAQELVRQRRIIVCVGAGGVGKTTLAAAIALGAARLGLRALVVTIDPARRLADALGLGSLGNVPAAIPRERLDKLGAAPEGHVEAMMLDMKSTFDDLVRRFADDEATRERIFANPIYQHVSDALAGSAEYSAMEKVYELSERDDLDLIVLDTPPSQHALDFLEAPERLIGFLDSRVVQVLLHPAFAGARFGFRVFQRGVHQVLKVVERISGLGFLEDLSEFLLAFEGMSEGFRARAHEVRGLLFGPRCAFVLAAGPAPRSVAHATQFLERLEGAGADVRGLVLNRMRIWPGDGAAPRDAGDPADDASARASLARALAADGLDEAPAREAAAAALRVARSYASLVRSDEAVTERLRERVRRCGGFVREVPEFRRDVHDLESLSRVADHVFGSGRARAEESSPV